MGVQVCNIDGGAWGTCQCGSGGSSGDASTTGGSGGGAGTGGSGGGSGGSTGGTGGLPAGTLGAPCATDDDCTDSLTCMTSAMGIPGGACTRPCAAAAECADVGGYCAQLGDQSAVRLCLLGCSFGPQDSTAFDPTKCHGRADMACTPTVDGPVCHPLCNSDSDCAGAFCNPGTGLCTATAPAGDPVGTTCTPGTTTCRGLCGQFGAQDSDGVCAELCTLGAPSACAGGASRAFCGATSGEIIDGGGPGVGDWGICLQVCDCTAQCLSTMNVCVDLGPDAPQTVGGRGMCVLPAAGSVELTTCP